MPPPLLFDLSAIDLNHVEVDIEGIRALNPQRGPMEQVTAIVHLDPVNHRMVGYKDVRDDEFWVSGHMPGYPLMPGVLICETAAQFASYYSRRYDLLGVDRIAFGGMEDIRFRGQVRPGDRLVIAATLQHLRYKRRATFRCQGFVKDTMVFHGDIIGVPLIEREE